MIHTPYNEEQQKKSGEQVAKGFETKLVNPFVNKEFTDFLRQHGLDPTMTLKFAVVCSDPSQAGKLHGEFKHLTPQQFATLFMVVGAMSNAKYEPSNPFSSVPAGGFKAPPGIVQNITDKLAGFNNGVQFDKVRISTNLAETAKPLAKGKNPMLNATLEVTF